MRPKRLPTELLDPLPYRIRDGVFRFPFVRLDPTPGGDRLGCMEWHVEFIPEARKRHGYRRIATVLLWATQTRDERYAGKTFAIPAHGEVVTFRTYEPDTVAYLAGVWQMRFCLEHKQLVVSSYPPVGTSALVVDVWLTTSLSVFYEC